MILHVTISVRPCKAHFIEGKQHLKHTQNVQKFGGGVYVLALGQVMVRCRQDMICDK